MKIIFLSCLLFLSAGIFSRAEAGSGIASYNFNLDRASLTETAPCPIASGYAMKFIRFYQRHGSKFMGSKCGFYPTCSRYGIGAFEKHGALEALLLTINRLQRCHPWNKGYYNKVFVEKRWANLDTAD